jgi:dihydroflavonol-4-reductase
MQVAVTGAAGHVGATLVRVLLARGDQVRVLVHTDTRGLAGLPVEHCHGSVTDPAAVLRLVQGAQRVYHLAAKVSIDPRERAELHRVNVGGTQCVVDACRTAGVARLVHVSSIHALASHPLHEPITEDRALATGRGLPGYDASKVAAERVVQAAVANGLDAVVLNPTAILGPHDCRPSHLGEVLLDLYHQRLPGLVAGGFDWVDVRDVAAGILAAADYAPAGSRYLLGGQRATVAELARLVAQVTGRPAPWLVTPMWLARAVAPGAEWAARLAGRRPLFTPESLYALRNHLDISSARARRDLGYVPRALEATVRDTFEWFREAGMLEP